MEGNWGEFDFEFQVQLKHAMFLEDEGRFRDAEDAFIKVGKPREAIDMYMHQQDWTAALRVADLYDPAAMSDVLVWSDVVRIDQCGGLLLMAEFCRQQYHGLGSVWGQVAQAQIMMKKKELQKAEALLIKVTRWPRIYVISVVINEGGYVMDFSIEGELR